MTLDHHGRQYPWAGHDMYHLSAAGRRGAFAREMLVPLGYDVTVCTSSLEALAAFRATPLGFDLVITDQTMPAMTGETLVRELRRIRPDIPLILCTGYSPLIDAERAAVLGIEAFLLKPVESATLAHTIRQVLTRRQGAEGCV